MRRFLLLLTFFTIWMLCDAYFNSVLLRTPFWGRYTHLIEWVHFLLYGGLGIFAAITGDPILFFLCLGWCFLDEYIQNLIPDRVADWLDVLRNVVGYLAGYLIMYALMLKSDGHRK